MRERKSVVAYKNVNFVCNKRSDYEKEKRPAFVTEKKRDRKLFEKRKMEYW